MDSSQKKVVAANVTVHSKMASSYNETEPHYRPENRAKVKKRLEDLAAKTPRKRMLDLGCGTGFVLDLARDLFQNVYGVDVTPAMLARVDRSSGNVRVMRSEVERLPFPKSTFDMVTAYSFLHHTIDIVPVIREAARVLRPGGIFYADLEPNRPFWDEVAALPPKGLHPWVAKARASVLETDARVEKDFGIPQETFREAEYTKAIKGGIDAADVEKIARDLGFSSCQVRLEWFLGQAEVMHGQSFAEADKIDAFLRNLSPLTDHLYKYIQFILVK